MNQTTVYDRIAKVALDRYDLARGQRCFLGHSGSVTFRIEIQEEKFLLRIHQAISGFQEDVWQRPEAIESELLWLAALDLDTELVVQQPIKNLQNRWVTQVDENKEVFYCSLLRWIDGEISKLERTPQQAYQLGALMAQLHQHSQQWQLPQNFMRPVYDWNRFKTALANLYSAISQGLISAENYKLLEFAACRVQKMMETLEQNRETWGIIHADLHDGNYLLNGDELRPIDFAHCGFGYYLYDVASAIQYLPPSIRSCFFEGYQTSQKLTENYIQITEGFFIVALLDVLSFHVNNPQEHQGVSDTVKEVAQEHIPLYLQGESFLFDKY
ncbi:MAG: phosphotransferase [Cyanosarcina radialis HA8281-LM2]|jgi:Ser/Thr protein kinase RdoA (MazF antagonist)|nr:phosphotransferase [Cyanosarcina radialis HA8281-LM2]